MRDFRVLIMGSLPPALGSRNYGGVARVVWALAQAHRRRGLNVTVAAMSKYYGGDKIVDGIPIYGARPDVRAALGTLATVVKNRRTFDRMRFREWIHLLLSLYCLERVSGIVGFDCIHVHHVNNQIPLAARLLHLDVPIVATVHSYTDVIVAGSEARRKGIVENLVEQLECVNYVTHVSEAVRQQGINLGVRWQCEDDVIHNGITLSDIDFQLNHQPRQIIFVGSLIERKGVRRLQEAIELLGSEVERVLWLGRGRLAKEVRDWSSEREVDSLPLGYLDHDEALIRMAESSVVVIPSVSESFGLVYVEALWTGTPIIGFHNIIDEIQGALRCNGREKDWLIPYNYSMENAVDLSNKIREALRIKQRATYCEERDSIRRKVANHFAWEKIADEYQRVYERVL